jgi:uncharacterized membrane protein YfcA
VQQQTPQRRRRKKLNISVIKGVVMMALGIVFGFLSALTGISPQVAAAPMIVFLLGYQSAKAQGTSLAYALCTAVGAVAGATASGLKPDYLVSFLLALGATIGAVFAVKATSGPRAKVLMRTGQSLAILIALLVLSEALRHRIGGPRSVGLEFLVANRVGGSLVVGLLTGFLAQLFQISTGIILVPALVYLVGLRVTDSVTISLAVFGLASLLPTLGYAARQAIDKGPGYWLCVGGTIGGLAGGLLLGRLGLESTASLVIFGLGAMILSGWTLSRIS